MSNDIVSQDCNERLCNYNDCLFMRDLEDLAMCFDDLSDEFGVILRYVGRGESDLPFRFQDLACHIRDYVDRVCEKCPFDSE